ncbi:MAG: aminopeptidase [Clostridiales bacterium]|nr:aminopeptidase [Clostridiales bacterium]
MYMRAGEDAARDMARNAEADITNPNENKKEKMEILAKTLVNISCEVKPGDRVLVEYDNIEEAGDLAALIVREIYKNGGIPFAEIRDLQMEQELVRGCTREQLAARRIWESSRLREMDGCICLKSSEEPEGWETVPMTRRELYLSLYQKRIQDIRSQKTRWVTLFLPNRRNQEYFGGNSWELLDYYCNACNINYKRLRKAMKSLVKYMNRTSQVHITGPGTDLSFSIEGMNAIPCAGEHNMPDGEVYTAPVIDSAEGWICFNVPTVYRGRILEHVTLHFHRGKVTDIHADGGFPEKEDFLNDPGAVCLGEFALGLNPVIDRPLIDSLFDEKAGGSFHLALGNAYANADNGSRSQIHWDLVCLQTPQWGGGEISFDGVKIRQDGRFQIEELLCCNPENLI